MTRKNNMTGLFCPICKMRMRRIWTKKRAADGTLVNAYECKSEHKWKVVNGVIAEQIGGVTEVNGMTVITRAEALEKGLPRYFTGKTCKHGHMCEKSTKGGYCIECKKEFIEKKKPVKESDGFDYEVKSPTQAEIQREFEELRLRHPNIRRIRGYAQSGSK